MNQPPAPQDGPYPRRDCRICRHDHARHSLREGRLYPAIFWIKEIKCREENLMTSAIVFESRLEEKNPVGELKEK
jgi:hypothetical protein